MALAVDPRPADDPDGARTVTLHVGVHRGAGTLYDLAADGAAGQCVALGRSRLVCPAAAPVRFRWGPGGDWELVGDTEVAPGDTGVAWVLPPDAARADAHARLAEPVTPDAVREVFLWTSARPVPPPSMDLFARLVELAAHEDVVVRREVARVLVPYARHTASDPFPTDAPSLIPDGVITALARDPDRRVRQRAAALIREMGPEDPRWPEAERALHRLATDPSPPVRRVAIVAWSGGVAMGVSDPLDAWRSALERVPQPGSPGRAACNALARLRDSVEPEAVDADGALASILAHHPERAWRFWGAWRDAIPFESGRASFLLRETAGLSEPLLQRWAERSPDELAAAIHAWEPDAPHSERHRVIGAWLGPRTSHPGLRAALALPAADSLSEPAGPDGGNGG